MDKEKKMSSENINQSQPANAEQTNGKKYKRLKPIAILDTKLSDFVDWLQTISVVKLAVTLSEVTILFAMVSYIVTIPNRRQQQIQEARKVLHEENKKQYSDGRIAALKVLNKHCEGNPGLQAPEGKMAKLSLYRCPKFDFQKWKWPEQRGMNLSNSNLKKADLSGANLQGINLRKSILQNAILVGANLEGADLTSAKLQNADLSRANLKGAILEGSNLNNSKLYGANFEDANLSEANLKGIRAEWANFNHANFYRANLESANFNRAQLMGADFYRANLKNSKLRFADLRNTKKGKQSKIGANLREADLEKADLWGTKFWSVFQLKQANNWDNGTRLMSNWEKQITHLRPPRLRIALLKSKAHQSIFNAYELGMRRAADRRVEILAIDYDSSQDQANQIKNLLEQKEKIDGIILTPEDRNPIKALKEASKSGIAITTVDYCFDPSKAEDLAIACYDTDKFKMGHESGQYLVKWAKRKIRDEGSQQKTVQVALVDGANYERYYPYFQGVLKSIYESDLHLEIKGSVGVGSDNDINNDIKEVEKLLKDKDNEKVEILWGGSNLATEVAIKAVKKSKRDKVKVFGILDLSMDEAEKLLDPNNPLESITYQYRYQVGYEAVKRTIDVLRGEGVSGADYKCIIIKHGHLTNLSHIPKERKKELISELQDFEKVDKKFGFKDCKSVSKHH